MSEQAGYEYLASPYTDPDPMVREMRYLRTAEVLVTMLKLGLAVYSPIVHCHELAKIWDLPKDVPFWEAYNATMLSNAKSLSVLRLDGWSRSAGVRGEIALATQLGKSITYIPGDMNAEAAVTIHQDKPHQTAP